MLKNEHYGSGFRKHPHFDGIYYDYCKCKMIMYLDSMSLVIAKIVDERFVWGDRDSPTLRNHVNMHHKAQDVSAIVSSLSSTEYAKVAGMKNT